MTEDPYVVAEVVGTKSLYPVVHVVSDTGRAEDAILPYALTNPLFIDVDGDGAFDSPWEEGIKLVREAPDSK